MFSFLTCMYNYFYQNALASRPKLILGLESSGFRSSKQLFCTKLTLSYVTQIIAQVISTNLPHRYTVWNRAPNNYNHHTFKMLIQTRELS